jgi:tetratricopeptide (TPR) repeat protein
MLERTRRRCRQPAGAQPDVCPQPGSSGRPAPDQGGLQAILRPRRSALRGRRSGQRRRRTVTRARRSAAGARAAPGLGDRLPCSKRSCWPSNSPAEAIASLQRFVERIRQRATRNCNSHARWSGEKRYSEAKRLFEQLLLSLPDNPDVVFPVAILALQENDTALAERSSSISSPSIPRQERAYYYLGQIAEEGKRTDEALAYYQQVGPGEHYLPAQIRSAAILARSGKLDEARQQLTQAAGETRSCASSCDRRSGPAARREADEAALELARTRTREQPRSLTCSTSRRCWPKRSAAGSDGKPPAQADRAATGERPGLQRARLLVRRSQPSLPEARQLIEKALLLPPTTRSFSTAWAGYSTVRATSKDALSYLQRAYGQRPDPEIAAHLPAKCCGCWAAGTKRSGPGTRRRKRIRRTRCCSGRCKRSLPDAPRPLTPVTCPTGVAPAALLLLLGSLALTACSTLQPPVVELPSPSSATSCRTSHWRPLFPAPRRQSHSRPDRLATCRRPRPLLLSSPFGQPWPRSSATPMARACSRSDGHADGCSQRRRTAAGGPRLPAPLASWRRLAARPPCRRAATLLRDAQGRPLRLRHEDWRIAYEYDSDEPQALPAGSSSTARRRLRAAPAHRRVVAAAARGARPMSALARGLGLPRPALELAERLSGTGQAQPLPARRRPAQPMATTCCRPSFAFSGMATACTFRRARRRGESGCDRWGVAKLVKAPDFDSGIRRFESFFPSHSISVKAGRGLTCPSCFIRRRFGAPREAQHGLRQPDGIHRQRQPQAGRRCRQALNISLGRAHVGRFSDGEFPSKFRSTCAARMSSSCNRPARRPTRT